MDATPILIPLLLMFLLTLVVWLTTMGRRIRYMMEHDIDAQEVSTPQQLQERIPEHVHHASNNFKNLFELPVIFYALVAILLTTNAVDVIHLSAAWVFVIFRVVHSLVHCTFNNVNARFGAYLVSSLALWAMVLRAVFQCFEGMA